MSKYIHDYSPEKKHSKKDSDSYSSQTVNVNLNCFDKKENKKKDGRKKEKSAFRAIKNANQAVPANTFVKVLYQNEQFDLANEYNPATSTFVPSEDGVYLVIGSMSFDPTNNNVPYRARIEIRVNGATNASIDNDFFGPSNFNNAVSVSSILRLQAGDVVEIFATSSIAGVIAPGGADNATHFEAARLA